MSTFHKDERGLQIVGNDRSGPGMMFPEVLGGAKVLGLGKFSIRKNGHLQVTQRVTQRFDWLKLKFLPLIV